MSTWPHDHGNDYSRSYGLASVQRRRDRNPLDRSALVFSVLLSLRHGRDHRPAGVTVVACFPDDGAMTVKHAPAARWFR